MFFPIFVLKCYANGLNYADFKSSQFKTNENVKSLEMYFNGFSTICYMDKFPNLNELKIVAQELEHISGLETCLNLNELWIIECKLKVKILFHQILQKKVKLNFFKKLFKIQGHIWSEKLS
jgi:hypothetical protein